MFREPMNLSRKVSDDLPVKGAALKNPDVFGIEIELEGRKVKSGDQDLLFFWDVHKDDSLRTLQNESEATEYVFREPLDYNQTEVALKLMFNFLNSPGVEVFPSYRTSIHVHINYAIEKAIVVYNAMVLSIILDELFTSQNGKHRIGNNFCLRARDAQGQINGIVKSIEGCGNFYNINPNHRYSSINFASLLKFGTIEYRSLECTTDYDRVRHWVDTTQRVKIAARDFTNPAHIIETFNQLTADQFLDTVLGPQAAKYKAVEGYEKMLFHGMRLAQDLAYCSTWTEMKAGDKPPPRRRRSAVLKPSPFSTAGYLEQAQAYLAAQQNNAPAHQWVYAGGGLPAAPQAAPQPVVEVEHEPEPFDDVDLDALFNDHDDDEDDD